MTIVQHRSPSAVPILQHRTRKMTFVFRQFPNMDLVSKLTWVHKPTGHPAHLASGHRLAVRGRCQPRIPWAVCNLQIRVDRVKGELRRLAGSLRVRVVVFDSQVPDQDSQLRGLLAMIQSLVRIAPKGGLLQMPRQTSFQGNPDLHIRLAFPRPLVPGGIMDLGRRLDLAPKHPSGMTPVCLHMTMSERQGRQAGAALAAASLRKQRPSIRPEHQPVSVKHPTHRIGRVRPTSRLILRRFHQVL